MDRHRPRQHHPAAEAPYPSSASLRSCREGKMPRRKGPQHPPPSGGREEPGEKRPKFHLNIRTLTDDVLDKFASIRIPGSKKERPPLSNLKTAFASSDCFSEMNENILNPLSEKELLDLFEKMMEDMNLNEDKKAPNSQSFQSLLPNVPVSNLLLSLCCGLRSDYRKGQRKDRPYFLYLV